MGNLINNSLPFSMSASQVEETLKSLCRKATPQSLIGKFDSIDSIMFEDKTDHPDKDKLILDGCFNANELYALAVWAKSREQSETCEPEAMGNIVITEYKGYKIHDHVSTFLIEFDGIELDNASTMVRAKELIDERLAGIDDHY